MQFTSEEARTYSAENRIAEWVDQFLTNSRFVPNLDMAQQLRERPTFWRGPLLAKLSTLIRACGPEPGMTFLESPEKWSSNVDRLLPLLDKGIDFPPLLIRVRNGKHFIADGSHRHEALIRRGTDRYWTIWYAHEERELDLISEIMGVL